MGLAPESPPVEAAPLDWAHPVVREWFLRRFGTPTEPQVLGWPTILSGRDALISAPTGSGKTLAACLACIDDLVRQAVAGTLSDRIEVVYVSPLKALGNDIQLNLDAPLAEIVALARRAGHDIPEIRTAVRTGDTLTPARRAMLQRPPHILVTTPESLYILLTAERSRAVIRSVRLVIVDEIHAVAGEKRGAHLALSLERLDALAGRPVPRIGLSATQKPIEVMAAFLGGSRPQPTVVEVPARRSLDLAVEVPSGELGPIASHELWSEVYDRIGALARGHRSTLVFVNTRRLSERVAHQLADRLGAEAVAAHHGSLSRKTRLDAERRLKAGDLRVLVATASLELGIDIGAIDLVCHVGPSRSIAAAVQRVGRAGHWRGATPKGRFFATTRDELVECAALVRAMRSGDLDRLVIPTAPLDILAQHIVAMCAAEDWDEAALFDTLRRAHPYRNLTRADFDVLLEMLSEGISARRGRYAAYLHRDRVNGRLRARRGARLAAITSGGAIPETGLYTVVLEPEGTVVGTVDEDFAVESMAGDVMLLGTASWRIRRVTTAGRVLVEDARGAAPTVPFWRGEAPARTAELSHHVSHVRRRVAELASDAAPGDVPAGASRAAAAIEWLKHECGLDQAGAEQLTDYVVLGRAVLGAVPSMDTVIAERFFDEGGGMQLVIHAPFGARINRAWGLALRKRFCRSFNVELQGAATDNGITISLTEQHSFPLQDVFGFLRTATVREVLEQAALQSPLFSTRWRWDAGRALALLRFRGGKKVPIHILRLQSDDLLASVFPDVAACQENIEGDVVIPDHPLVREAMKDVLTEAMDLEGLTEVLRALADGAIRTVAVDTPVPSVFSHEILNANPYAFLDDAPLEERRTRAVSLRRVLPETVLAEIGRLDPAAIAEVQAHAWPDVRHEDDLHDALQTLIALPVSLDPSSASPLAARVTASASAWAPWFDALRQSRRATRATARGKRSWVTAEHFATARLVFTDLVAETDVPAFGSSATSQDAVRAMVQGWLSHVGPTTANELAQVIGIDPERVDESVLGLEAAGWVLRGTFAGLAATETPPAERANSAGRSAPSLEWCERRLLARIHRLTLGTLRREIAPVTASDFMRWLFSWQHLAPGTAARGERGTLEVLRQLQGFEAPASTWEAALLPSRIADYDPTVLDHLCLTGVVGWGRLSPHPAVTDATITSRRVVPTSAAPVTFFVREEADWMLPVAPRDVPTDRLSPNASDVLQVLRHAGASFFSDILRGAGHLKSEVETALWELVAAGLVTADGFDSLRSLIDPRRRAGQGAGRTSRPRHGCGRWALLYPHAAEAPRGQAAESACRMLLARYGVVFRELMARESNVPTWRELLIAFRRLEDRGEVRGGRFVSGFLGEQFALPIAADSLRADRHRQPVTETLTFSAADPLNLAGIVLPGDRIPALSNRHVVYRSGTLAEAAGHERGSLSAAVAR